MIRIYQDSVGCHVRSTRKYSDVRHHILNGMLILWEPTSLFGRVIADLSDGPYSHVSSVSWSGEVLECHEMLQGYGGRTVNLSALVRQYPGKMHVYQVPRVHGYIFSQRQRRRAGEWYGWADLLMAAGSHVLGSGRHIHLHEIDKKSKAGREMWETLYLVPIEKPAFCSEAIVSDLRASGVDIFPELAAWEVAPNAVASACEYKFTLV